MIRITCIAAVILFSVLPLRAQILRQDLRIPVRDGSSIAGDLYSTDTTVARPVILIQTPYNKNLYRLSLGNGIGGAMPYDPWKYHYVITDWRGFYGSKEAPAAGYDRGLDGYDIIQWLLERTWCSGAVGTWGASALGVIQFQTARHHPPGLICSVPLVKDFKNKYSDYYYGGALRREHVESLERLGFITVDLVTSHPDEDFIWRAAEQATDYPEDIAVPMLLIGGWFDHYPSDVLRAFSDLQQRSDASVRDRHRMIMGPWTHSGVDREEQGELTFPDAVNVARDEALRFFEYHLLGAKNGWPLTAKLRYYNMGAYEFPWEEAGSWDEARGAQRTWFWLTGDGTLMHTRPPYTGASSTEMASDPRNPVPSYGSARFNPFDPTVEAGPLDIRDVVERHPDVLLFTADLMPDNLHVSGRMDAVLYVSSDRRDADVCVRVCDVYPDGRSMILTEGIRRLRFRNGYDREEPAAPDSVYRVVVPLQDLAWTPHDGHRLRLVISGSSWPRFDINPNNGGPLYQDGDSLVAHLRLHHTEEYPSHLEVDAWLFTGVASPSVPGRFAIGIYPQPFDGNGTLHFHTGGAAGTLMIHDILGRHIATLGEGSGHCTMDGYAWSPRGVLAPGMYVVRFVGSHGTSCRSFLVGK